jgi:hypothetical protein
MINTQFKYKKLGIKNLATKLLHIKFEPKRTRIRTTCVKLLKIYGLKPQQASFTTTLDNSTMAALDKMALCQYRQESSLGPFSHIDPNPQKLCS